MEMQQAIQVAVPKRQEPSLDSRGYLHIASVVSRGRCAELALDCENVAEAAGARHLLDFAWCRELAAQLRGNDAVAATLPASHVAVRCNLFRKSSTCNWQVTLHQDLSIPVTAWGEAAGWSGWSLKDGVDFVQPPAQVLEQLIALRLHLDDCGPNAPWPWCRARIAKVVWMRIPPTCCVIAGG